MTKLERHAAVIRLACMTEDRDGQEQRALLDTALETDVALGSFASRNVQAGHARRPSLTRHAEATYDPSVGRRVELTAAQRTRLLRLEEAWTPCPDCDVPKGAHALDPVTRKPRCP